MKRVKKNRRKGKIPIRLKEAKKSLREARRQLKRPKPQISEVHAQIWGAAPPAAWGTAAPQSISKKKSSRDSLQSSGMPGNEESDPPRSVPRTRRASI